MLPSPGALLSPTSCRCRVQRDKRGRAGARDVQCPSSTRRGGDEVEVPTTRASGGEVWGETSSRRSGRIPDTSRPSRPCTSRHALRVASAASVSRATIRPGRRGVKRLPSTNGASRCPLGSSRPHAGGERVGAIAQELAVAASNATGYLGPLEPGRASRRCWCRETCHRRNGPASYASPTSRPLHVHARRHAHFAAVPAGDTWCAGRSEERAVRMAARSTATSTRRRRATRRARRRKKEGGPIIDTHHLDVSNASSSRIGVDAGGRRGCPKRPHIRSSRAGRVGLRRPSHAPRTLPGLDAETHPVPDVGRQANSTASRRESEARWHCSRWWLPEGRGYSRRAEDESACGALSSGPQAASIVYAKARRDR